MRGLEAALQAARGELPDGVGWRIVMHNRIPLARGLGSSAAATVVGVVAGNALLGKPLASRTCCASPARSRATRTTPPPRSSAGSRSPGTSDGVEAVRFDAPRDLRAVLFIPELRLSTDEMRKALPEQVPLVDAVANLGAVALGVAGLATGRYDLLRLLTVDRLHEPYRAAVYPQLPRLIAAARGRRAGAALGRGSTILAFADSMSGISRIEGAFGAAAATSTCPAGSRSSSHATTAPGSAGLTASGSRGSWPTNARTSSQAAALSSANSVALRSKKLCGASGYVITVVDAGRRQRAFELGDMVPGCPGRRRRRAEDGRAEVAGDVDRRRGAVP